MMATAATRLAHQVSKLWSTESAVLPQNVEQLPFPCLMGQACS